MEIIELMDSEGNLFSVPIYDKEDERDGIFMTTNKKDESYD